MRQCEALPGYDLTTGWDASGQGLINDLSGVSNPPAFSLSHSAATLALTQGSNGAVTITITPQNRLFGDCEPRTGVEDNRLAYRSVSNSTKDNRTFQIYTYSFTLNSGKTVITMGVWCLGVRVGTWLPTPRTKCCWNGRT
jgi:hypothetical protein